MNNTQNNTQQPNQHPAPERPPAQTQEQTRRYNPRLVFADPDKFFSDLLMEQEEQG